MSTAVLERLCSERDQARDAAIAMAESESFNPDDATFTDLQTRAQELDKRVSSLSKLMEDRNAADALDGKLAKVQRRQDERSGVQTREETPGELFVRSEIYRDYPGRGTSQRFEIEERALPMTTAGWAETMRVGPQFNVQDPELPDLIIPLTTVITVSGNSVEYVEYTKTAGGADIVAEGAAKPSAEWEPNVSSATLDNIAVYTQLTRQLIEDAAAVRSFIDSELRREIIRKAEEEAIAALVAATLPTATGPAGSGVIGAVRAGMAAVQAKGYRANAFLVHSDDLVDMDIAVMNSAGIGPNRTNSYWGLTPVVDPNATKGRVTVGDFKAGIQHYQRSGVSLYVSDSHGDTFTKNIFTLLSEQRSKTVVVRPGCLVEATATA